MNLLLARHGNTFAPQDPVVWVGAKNDLPLVDTGRAQAKHLGRVLASSDITLPAIYSAPLRRTLEYAEIIQSLLQNKPEIVTDPRLTEIDYGLWTGLSNAQIQSKYGSAELELWERKSLWPKNAGWNPSEEVIFQGITALCQELKTKTSPSQSPLIVSSNGILRYFLKLNVLEWSKRCEDASFKVKTGNLCHLVLNEDSAQVKFWNHTPEVNMLHWEAS